jgi:hypothetical protein
MKSALSAILLGVLALFLFQTSCEEKSVGPALTYWDAVKAIISEHPSLFRLGFFDTEPDTESFYREITSSHADIEEGLFNPGDPDDITLTWSDSVVGKLHYDSSGHPHEKLIVFKTRTRAYFERLGTTQDRNLGWMLRQSSGTVITSMEATREIDELHIISEGVDTLIYESTVMRLVRTDSTLVFGKGKQVTFIVEPADPTDSLFLHVKEGGTYQKIHFVREGEETFTASWTTIEDPGPGRHYYHAIVDVVSRESLASDTTDYEFKAWGIVYRVE